MSMRQHVGRQEIEQFLFASILVLPLFVAASYKCCYKVIVMRNHSIDG
jgi:hypothetical protein